MTQLRIELTDEQDRALGHAAVDWGISKRAYVKQAAVERTYLMQLLRGYQVDHAERRGGPCYCELCQAVDELRHPEEAA